MGTGSMVASVAPTTELANKRTDKISSFFSNLKAKVGSFVDGLFLGNDTSALAVPA